MARAGRIAGAFGDAVSRTIAGKYVPVRPLAAGGMAEVDLARQVGIDGFEKLVVLKRIRPEFANDREFVTRFLDEARTVADLRHPNLVQVYEAGRDGDGFFLAMAFVHGASVRQMTREAEARKERVPLQHAVHVTIGAARGLHYAHEKADLEGRPLGIVHRDVSPQNLLVSFQGEVKVADFGIARADNQQHLTRPGHIWGKLAYMAPEQARAGVVTAASDQFALAIVAWELFSGERLFHRDTDAETLRGVLAASIPSIASRVSGFPPAIERVLERALSVEPAARYPSCAAFAAELEAAAARVPLLLSDGRLGEYLSALFPKEAKELSLPVDAASPGAAAPESLPSPSRRRVTAVLLGVSLAAGAALGIAWLRSAPRLVREAEAHLAAGRWEDALSSARQILRRDPADERARQLATLAATEILVAKSTSPETAETWLRDLVRDHPTLEEPLREELLVLEVRKIATKGIGPDVAQRVSDFVLTHRDSPKVAHAGAEVLKLRGYDAIAYLWMRELAMEGGIKPPPEALAEAISVMQDRTLPDHPACGAARYVGMKVDVLAFEEWSRRAVLSGEGYELVNATAVGPTLTGMGHLRFLVRVLTSAEKTVLGSEEFILDVRALPQSELERILRTMRTIAADDNLKPWRQRELQRLLQEIEKPPSR